MRHCFNESKSIQVSFFPNSTSFRNHIPKKSQKQLENLEKMKRPNRAKPQRRHHQDRNKSPQSDRLFCHLLDIKGYIATSKVCFASVSGFSRVFSVVFYGFSMVFYGLKNRSHALHLSRATTWMVNALASSTKGDPVSSPSEDGGGSPLRLGGVTTGPPVCLGVLGSKSFGVVNPSKSQR